MILLLWYEVGSDNFNTQTIYYLALLNSAPPTVKIYGKNVTIARSGREEESGRVGLIVLFLQ
jgi:hypothetical protein